jgi:hypothetical protein
MAETLGSLIDKLTIANVRLWHLEDIRRDRSLPDKERLAAADKIAVVNSERNSLIDEIDDYLYQALQGRVQVRVPRMKIYKEFKLEGKGRSKKKSPPRKKKKKA